MDVVKYNAEPTSCNIDSNVILCTQNSLPCEMDANASTPRNKI